jgi:hypothetical protein
MILLSKVKEKWKKRLQGTSSYTLILQKAYNLEVETCIEIALRSVETDREKRPTIREIVDKLNKLETVRKSLTGQVLSSYSRPLHHSYNNQKQNALNI